MLNTTERQLKIFLLIICCYFNIILGGPDQRRLLKYLLTDRQHDPLERPVKNDSHTLPITINLALQQIIDFDGKNEILTISGWLVLMWQDYSLTWNPEEFGDIHTLRIPSAQIWTPDILLYNCADEKFDSTMKVNAVVQHTGDILYVPPGLFKSICQFNSATFPFVSINLTAEHVKGQLDAYVKNAEWDLEGRLYEFLMYDFNDYTLDFYSTNGAVKYDCCPTLYPYVLFTIRIRRRSLYYFTNIVVPCFLISCMTILGFLLAPDSGEKLTLQITILLSVVMFSLLMSEIMPPNSNAVPIITKYFLCVMILSTISVAASVLVISVHFRNAKNHTMSLWIRKYISHYLARILFMRRPKHGAIGRTIRYQLNSNKEQTIRNEGRFDNHQHKSPYSSWLNNVNESLPNNVMNIDEQSHQYRNDREKQHSDSMLEFSTPLISQSPYSYQHQDISRVLNSLNTEAVRSELRIIINQLATFTDKMIKQEEIDDESQEWKFVAMVIDRLCLIFFTISMTIFSLLIYLSAPNGFSLR